VSYTIKVDRLVVKAMKALDKPTARRIYERLKELSHDPNDIRISKPLKILPGQRSSRVGHWRIIYRVEEESQTIMITAVKPRGEAYK